MTRLNHLFTTKKEPILSIYFTAGFPELGRTLEIAEVLQKSGADFLEIGFPYSDPVADGPVIQHSSQKALENGMTLPVLFDQLKELRKRVSIPVLLMGYVNPVLQYGMERFCASCAEVGVDGVIVPDLPMYEYEELYRDCFQKHNVSNVFLITPQTSEERIRKIDDLTTRFIYMLSSASTTGKNLSVSSEVESYFERINRLELKNPRMVGFGISDKASFDKAAEYTRGAIVGSAVVKLLDQPDWQEKVQAFIRSLREG